MQVHPLNIVSWPSLYFFLQEIRIDSIWCCTSFNRCLTWKLWIFATETHVKKTFLFLQNIWGTIPDCLSRVIPKYNTRYVLKNSKDIPYCRTYHKYFKNIFSRNDRRMEYPWYQVFQALKSLMFSKANF